MSGFLGTALTAVNTFEAGSSLLSGILGDYPVVLGNFGFSRFECPQNINFGGSNTISIHRLCGGIRVFDVLGSEEHDMSWSGELLTADAVQRATQLKAMQKQSPVQTLTFGAFSYNVLIKEVECVYHKANWITYKIDVMVISNQQPVSSVTQVLADVVNDAITAAQDISIVSSIIDSFGYSSAVSSALADLAAVQAAETAAISAGSAAAQALEAGVQAAVTAVAAVQATATANLTALGDGPSQGGGQAAAAFVNSAAVLAQQTSEINQVQNYLGASLTNLSN